MGGVLVVGASHREASVDQLERLTIADEAMHAAAARLRSAGIREFVLVSTCSRTECYALADDPADAGASRAVLEALGIAVDIPAEVLAPIARVRHGAAAVEHLFAVAAGLDSRLFGDGDVRDQVRAAGSAAVRNGFAGPALGALFSRASRTADRVHAETGLGAPGSSLGRQAADFGLAALEIGASRRTPVVAVVGAGRMAAAVCRRLEDRGIVADIYARSVANARRLGDAVARVRPLDELGVALEHADLIIFATSARVPWIAERDIVSALDRREQPMTIVDLALPRNIRVSDETRSRMMLIDLDGLGDDGSGSQTSLVALRAARRLVAEEAQKEMEDSRARTAGALIAAMRQQVEAACLAELSSSLGVGGSPDIEITRAAKSAAAKLLHQPTIAARQAAAAGDIATLDRIVREFRLRNNHIHHSAI